jgi:hypothetical protein
MKTNSRQILTAIAYLVAFSMSATSTFADPIPNDRALDAMRRAVNFYRQQVAAHGGYVYRYSADLKKREGEGKVDLETVWVQPPGTPAVGLAYLDAFERTRQPELLVAARAAGECLIQGQLRSGGWQDRIQAIIDSLDERGAWVEDGKLRYHGGSDDTRRVIDSTTFIRNLNLLSRYLDKRSRR